MNRIRIIIISAMLLSSCPSLLSQIVNGRGLYNAIKLNIFQIYDRELDLKYERAINEHFSAQLGYGLTYSLPRYLDISWSGGSINDIDYWSSLSPEIRYYMNSALKGTYFSVFGRYEWFNNKWDHAEHSDKWEYRHYGQAFRLGGAIGRCFILGERTVIDIYGGPQFRDWELGFESFKNGVQNERNRVSDDRLNLKIGFNMGFQF